MGRVIQKQLDGLYAVWSTVVDDYVAIDCNKEQAIEISLALRIEMMRTQIDQQIERGLKWADEDHLAKCRKQWSEEYEASIKKDSKKSG